MTVRIDISDFLRGLEDEKKQLAKDMEEEAEFLADTMLNVARDATPERTGTLKRGWEKRREGKDVVVVNEVPYSIYVDQGTTTRAGQHMTDLAIDAALASQRNARR